MRVDVRPLTYSVGATAAGAVAPPGRGVLIAGASAGGRAVVALVDGRDDEATVSDEVQDAAGDAHLVEATLDGDRPAFGSLVRRYQKRVFALAYRYVGNEADAADLTQRAFLKAFEQLDRLRRREAFAPWLFRTAANLAKNEIRFRAAKRFEDVDDTILAFAPRGEVELVARSQREAMRRALAELPDKQRQCITLRIDGELSFKEIGAAVGCSEGSARVNFHHGLKALRRRLNPPADQSAPAAVRRGR